MNNITNNNIKYYYLIGTIYKSYTLYISKILSFLFVHCLIFFTKKALFLVEWCAEYMSHWPEC